MPLILGTNSIKDTGFNVANSLRFNSSSADYLNRTPSSASNRKTWTWSSWVKKVDNTTSRQFIFNADSSSQNTSIEFKDNAISVFDFNSGSYQWQVITSAIFRDNSAWMHICVAINTADGTASNRVKIYVNGSQITSFSTSNYPSLNYESKVNLNVDHRIGSISGSTTFDLDGYIAEAVLIDGQQLDATSFGEFDEDSNIWKPKDVSGLTFGTNGFYLDFENSGSLGADVSGNGNNFTVNNLTSIDQSTDTCTNNYATLNRLYLSASSLNFTEGNLTNNGNSSNEWRSIYATIGLTSGKWYFEIRVNKVKSSDLGNIAIGIVSEDQVVQTADNGKFFGTSRGYAYHSKTGKKLNNDENEIGDTYGDTWTTVGDIIGCAIDLDNHKIYWRKNGTYQNSGNPESGATGTGSAFDLATGYTYLVAIATYYDDERYSFNFGSPPYSESGGNSDGNGYGNFAGSVPSGYYALNTKNLAEYG